MSGSGLDDARWPLFMNHGLWFGGLCIQAQPLDQGWYEKYCVQSRVATLIPTWDELILV